LFNENGQPYLGMDTNIIPDYQNKLLNVKLYSQSSPRMNEAVKNICKLLNETITKYPGTNLIMNYEIAT